MILRLLLALIIQVTLQQTIFIIQLHLLLVFKEFGLIMELQHFVMILLQIAHLTGQIQDLELILVHIRMHGLMEIALKI